MPKNTFRNKKRKQRLYRSKIKVSTNAKKSGVVIIAVLFITILLVLVAIYETEKLPTGTSGGNTTNNFPDSISGFSKISTSPSQINGKIPVQFIGSLACPFCAEFSWSLYSVLASSGTWHGIEDIYSNYTDRYPDTPGLSFANATYSSLSIVFLENEISNRHWESYQSLNTTNQKLFSSDDPSGEIPFILIGGMYLRIGDYYSPAVLANTSGSSIMTWLSNGVNNSITDNIQNVTVDMENVLTELEKNSSASTAPDFSAILSNSSEAETMCMLSEAVFALENINFPP